MMDEQEFRTHSDAALNRLNQALIDAGDEYGFETDFNAGALTIEFEKPKTRFVVSPNTPVRQVWVSALSRSFKLDWDYAKHAFALNGDETLHELMARVIGEHLGEMVTL